MLTRHFAACCAWMLLVAVSVIAHAENWPMWRGLRGDGTSSEEKLPTTWSETENIAWKVAIPGEGHASPIVWDYRVFVTSCLPDGQRVLLCLNRLTGETLWQQAVITTELENIHKL